MLDCEFVNKYSTRLYFCRKGVRREGEGRGGVGEGGRARERERGRGRGGGERERERGRERERDGRVKVSRVRVKGFEIHPTPIYQPQRHPLRTKRPKMQRSL